MYHFASNNSSDSEHYSYEARGLRVHNLSASDAGVYKCRAEVRADGRYEDRTITLGVLGISTVKIISSSSNAMI